MIVTRLRFRSEDIASHCDTQIINARVTSMIRRHIIIQLEPLISDYIIKTPVYGSGFILSIEMI